MDYTQVKQIEFRRKFFKMFGASITAVAADSQQPLLNIQLKSFSWKQDIRVFGGAGMQQELMQIKAQKAIAFSGRTFDIIDSQNSQVIFQTKRNALKSAFVRDHWDLQDTAGNKIGVIQETSSALAIARRWLEVLPFGGIIALIFSFIAQTYDIRLVQAGEEKLAARIVHRKNPFIVKMLLDTSVAAVNFDTRLAVAATALLAIDDAAKND